MALGETSAVRKYRIRGYEVRAKIAPLLRAGMSYEQIGVEVAKALRFDKPITRQAVSRHVLILLKERAKLTAQDTDLYVELELDRLDSQLMSLWPKRSDPRVADTILRIGERRDRLKGVAPIKIEQRIEDDRAQVTADELAAKVEAVLSNARARMEARQRHASEGSAGEGDTE